MLPIRSAPYTSSAPCHPTDGALRDFGHLYITMPSSNCPLACMRSCLHAGLPHEGGTNNLDAYTRSVDCKP